MALSHSTRVPVRLFSSLGPKTAEAIHRNTHPSIAFAESSTKGGKYTPKNHKGPNTYGPDLSNNGKVPPYPYGPSHWYKQRNRGLYGNTCIQFGNMVSERNEIKTRRKWHPNIRSKRLWSESLNRFVRLKIHSRVLRTIDKVGGLDEYVLGEKAARIKELGVWGWGLRWRIMRTDKVRERFRLQRIEMGLPEAGLAGTSGVGEMGLNGEVKSEDELIKEEREFDQRLDREEKMAEAQGQKEARLNAEANRGSTDEAVKDSAGAVDGSVYDITIDKSGEDESMKHLRDAK